MLKWYPQAFCKDILNKAQDVGHMYKHIFFLKFVDIYIFFDLISYANAQ